MIDIKLNIKLHKNQQLVHDGAKRLNVIKAGKRWGKTKLAIYRAIKKAGQLPNGTLWYVCPTYRQAKQIAWWEFLRMLPPQLIKRRLETDLIIELFNTSRIYLIGADNEDALRGPKIDHVVMDEASYQKEYIWPSILSGQLLGDEGTGTADFISSPNNMGRNWFTDFYDDAKRRMAAGDSDWTANFFTIYDNPTLSRSEIEKLRSMVPEDVWELEYMAQESAFAGPLYGEFDLSKHVGEISNFGQMKLVMSLDWGIDHPTVCLWIYIDVDKKLVYVADEFVKSGYVIEESCSVINRITGNRAVEWRVIDPSTSKRSGQTGIRDMDEFARHGIYCIPGDNRSRGIDITKMFLKKGMIKIHPKCKTLIFQLKNLQRTGKTGDDCPDSLRYACVRIHDFMFGGKLLDTEADFKGEDYRGFGSKVSLLDPDIFPQSRQAREPNAWLSEEYAN